MIQVLVRFNNIDAALKALKRKLQREGVFKAMKTGRHYVKPSEARVLKEAESQRRRRKIGRRRKWD